METTADVIKRGNTFPYLSFEFFNEDGERIDCSLYAVRLLAQDRYGNIVLDSVVGSAPTGAVWVNQAQGIGEYQWNPGDTDILGKYKYEFKFTRLHDDKPFRIPENGFFYYLVRESIDDGSSDAWG